MKTRRQRKGGGIMGLAKASYGNLANGGGRLTQFNLIINRVKNWRKFKRMMVLMGGDELADSKWNDINLGLSDEDAKVESALAQKTGDTAPAAPAASNGGTRKNKRNRI